MQTVLMVSGLLSLVLGGIVATSIRSDIQVQIFASCIIGALLMFGQVGILAHLKALREEVKEAKKP